MRRLPLLSLLSITALLASCQGRNEYVDPTLPGALSNPTRVNTVASSTPPPGALIASPAPDPLVTPTSSTRPVASAVPSPTASADTGDGADDQPVGNITVLEAPSNHQGDAAINLTLQLPLFSELSGVRKLGAVKVVIKRDGILLNPTIATATVDGARVIDQVAAVQVNHCESGAYMVQLDAQDVDGKSLGTAEYKFKLEAGGAHVVGAKMAYVLANGTSSLKLTVAETPAVYVQAGTPSSMTVMWQGNASATSKVVLNDSAGQYVTNKTGAADRQHVLRFTGLNAGTTYQYVAYEGDTQVGAGSFRTNDGPGTTTLKFACIGDSGQGTAGQFGVAKQLSAWKPNFVMHVGDLVYPSGAASAYGPYYVVPYRDLIASTVMYPVLGNHDYRTDNGQPWLNFFEAPRANPDDTERYYTFSSGNVQCFALDTNQDYAVGSAQYKWFEEQLKASTATWKIPFFHHPPYSSGWHGSDLKIRAALAPLFEKYHCQLVLTGHDHHYERTKPQNGVTYVVTGGGGAALRDVKPGIFDEVAQARYEFFAMTVNGEKMVIEAIDDKGTTFDSTTLSAK